MAVFPLLNSHYKIGKAVTITYLNSHRATRMKRLLKISEKMKKTSPVFIIGDQRSGSSILYRTMQKHSSFTPREINLEETQIFNFLPWSFRFRKGYPSQLYNFMLQNESCYEEFISTIKVLRLLHLVILVPNLLLRDLPTMRWWTLNLNHHVIVRCFYS